MKRFLLILLLSLGLKAEAQLNTFITYDAAIPKDAFYHPTNSGNVKYLVNRTGVPGFRVTQQIYKQLNLELGGYLDYFAIDVVSDLDSTGIFFAQNQIHIPFRLQFRQPLFKERVYLTATSGVNYVIDWFTKYSYSLVTPDRSLSLRTTNFKFDNKHFLLEAGLGAEFFISTNFYLGVKYNMNFGTKNILEIDSEIFNGNKVVSKSSLRSKGSYNSLVFSLGYRVSRFWHK